MDDVIIDFCENAGTEPLGWGMSGVYPLLDVYPPPLLCIYDDKR